MRLNSTGYIVGFAAAVCLVCSLFVSSAAVFLQDRQRTNALLDKQRNVLQAAQLVEAGEPVSAERVQELFAERVDLTFVDVRSDAEVPESEAPDPASYDQQRAAKNPQQSVDVPPNPAQVARVPYYLPFYRVYNEEGELDGFVLPVEGMGLWGTLYGFLALEEDTRTIRGLTFYAHKETPGLGGEVDNPNWKAKWPGRLAYGPDWEPRIEVIKGQAGTVEETPYKVDGLSGATFTSNGVTNALRFWLGDEAFGPFLEKLRTQQSTD